MNRTVNVVLLGVLAAYGAFAFAHQLAWDKKDMDGLSGLLVLGVGVLTFVVALDKD